jgi:hypothetical protein
MKDSIILGLLLGMIHGLCQPVHSRSVVPNFTNGTVTSDTTTRTEVTEIIKQIEYSTGSSYTVTGTNIRIPSNPGPNTQYSIIQQGAPFQFSETYMGPGISKDTTIQRTTIIDSVTNSISVFTQ